MKKVSIIVLFFVLSLTFTSCGYMNQTSEKATVTGKERINKSESSYYLIFTNKGTYKITDQVFYGKFNSSDMYGKIIINNTYIFELGGYRMPLFSQYQNIKSFVLVTKKETLKIDEEELESIRLKYLDCINYECYKEIEIEILNLLRNIDVSTIKELNNVELKLFLHCILNNELYKPKIKEINDTIK